MEAKANAKFVRISPRKVNVVLDLVRGKDVKYAEAVLKHTPKAACEPLLKLLNSAMANAENNHDMDVSKLYIAQCNATAGPILKRIRPRAQGRAFRINKRTSHISLRRHRTAQRTVVDHEKSEAGIRCGQTHLFRLVCSGLYEKQRQYLARFFETRQLPGLCRLSFQFL